MNGIVAYGAYLPYFRLDRKAIGDALGSGGGKGTRVVASYDEDTTSMGVEAARAALRGAPRLAPAAVYFATADPAYLDKTNATAIHAALALDESAMAFDMLGSIRSGAGALRAAIDAGRPTLAVALRHPHRAAGRRGRARRRRRGGGLPARRGRRDAPGAGRARRGGVGHAPSSSSAGACPATPASRQWEERFGEHAYVPLAEAAIASALKQAGVTARRAGRADRGGVARAREQARGGGGGREARRRSPTISPARWATPAPPTRGCSWPTRSTARRPTT